MLTQLEKKERSFSRYDLGTRLHRSRWLYSKPIGSMWMVYAPDWRGMPVLMPEHAANVLKSFEDGATVGSILSKLGDGGTQFQDAIQIIDRMFDRGFLRESQDSEQFTIIGPDKENPPDSIEVWLHINNTCNLGCSYCFVDEYIPGGSGGSMTEATIEATVKRLGDTARQHKLKKMLIKFAGGEPTLIMNRVEKFFDLASAELSNTSTILESAILTNGTRITDQVIAFAKRTGTGINISIDGFEADHDRYRVFRTPKPTNDLQILSNAKQARKGSWTTIVEAIDRLLDNGIVPGVNATLSWESCSSLPDLMHWIFVEKKLESAYLGIVRNEGCTWGDSSRKENYPEYCQLLQNAFEGGFQVLEQHPEVMLDLPKALQVAELSFENPLADQCCGMGTSHMVIRHDGNLAACPMTVNDHSFVPVDDLLATMRSTFTTHPSERGGEDDCLSCQWYKVCGSACPESNKRFSGHYFTKSPLCEFWKYVIPRYLDFYGRKLLQAMSRWTEMNGGSHENVH